MAFSFSSRLSSSNNILLVDHEMYTTQNLPVDRSIKSLIITTIFMYLTGVRFRRVILPGKQYALEFDYKKFGINRIEPIIKRVYTINIDFT